MEGFILVGGKSRRMGTDKAGLLIGGKTMVVRAADVLASIAVDGISVVGGSSDAASNFPVIEDPEIASGGVDRSGPMLGLYAALSAARSEWIAVLACDLPFVSGELLQTLAAVEGKGFDAVVPVQIDGIAQPLCALYRCEPCRAVIYNLLNDGDRSMRSLLASIKTRFLGFEDLKGLKGSQNFFLNVNSPDDYANALTLSRSTD
jgi:molybdopterin-guanine dinucleotide biosynthesis protein A